MCRTARLCLLLLLFGAPAAGADLYGSVTIVSGMDGRSRPEGLMRALRQVLVKVSGNPAWLDDPRVGDSRPDQAVRSLAYLDRFTNLPKHDEQGSRDRPYDLVAHFEPGAVDGLLRGWGDAPWPEPRPTLAVDIVIAPRVGPAFPMRADTDTDERHRGALLAAADLIGLEVAIPATLAPKPPPAGSLHLVGRLEWSDRDAGWNSEWQVERSGAVHRWAGRGEGFDAAYRTGLLGAAASLSGHSRR